jgi:RNA polymerase sigma factor (TIGR02999 family)
MMAAPSKRAAEWVNTASGRPIDRMCDVTRILNALDHSDACASDELLPLVYDELRKLAAQKLSHEKPGQTLQATALVHEAYLRLVDTGRVQHWDNRGHFFAAAAESMRRILVEAARRKGSLKRGGDLARCDLDSSAAVVSEDDAVDLVALDAALEKLNKAHPQKAELVKLRFFAGLTLEQAAQVLRIAPATADRHWAYARAWLYREVSGAGGPSDR